jgi:ketosteroid isomerase-like protein
MSQENVDLTRTYFDLIARASSKDFDTETTISKMAEFWDPELEWDASEAPFDLSQVGRGIEAGRQWCRDWFTAWEALQFEYEVVDAGDRVVTLLDLRMRGRSTGIEVVLGEHAWVTTFRDGLMVRNKLYMDQSEALEAVGLSEQAMSQENVEIVRSIYKPWALGDFRSVEWAHPEIEFVIADFGPLVGSTKGLAGMAETWRTFLGAWEEYRCEVDEYRELDDERVLVLLHIIGRGKSSGVELGHVRTKAANLFHVRVGKVTRLVIWADQERGLAELGLSEQDAHVDSP